MASWYSKDLGDGIQSKKPTDEIMETFYALRVAGSLSSDAAVFSRYDLGSNMVTVYFTPSAELLTRAFGAVPCEKADPQKGISLIVGEDGAWEAHFPGYRAERKLSRG